MRGRSSIPKKRNWCYYLRNGQSDHNALHALYRTKTENKNQTNNTVRIYDDGLHINLYTQIIDIVTPFMLYFFLSNYKYIGHILFHSFPYQWK